MSEIQEAIKRNTQKAWVTLVSVAKEDAQILNTQTNKMAILLAEEELQAARRLAALVLKYYPLAFVAANDAADMVDLAREIVGNQVAPKDEPCTNCGRPRSEHGRYCPNVLLGDGLDGVVKGAVYVDTGDDPVHPHFVRVNDDKLIDKEIKSNGKDQGNSEKP